MVSTRLATHGAPVLVDVRDLCQPDQDEDARDQQDLQCRRRFRTDFSVRSGRMGSDGFRDLALRWHVVKAMWVHFKGMVDSPEAEAHQA
jgi:hypothetical protein